MTEDEDMQIGEGEFGPEITLSNTDDELAANLKATLPIPALFVDHFNVAVSPQFLRIAVGEGGPGGPHYRAAFVIPRKNAEQLSQIIKQLLERSHEP